MLHSRAMPSTLDRIGLGFYGVGFSLSYLPRHPFVAMKQIAEAKKRAGLRVAVAIGEKESPAERCRKNGWKVGTRLVGVGGTGSNKELGTTVIELTAIRERMILVKGISYNGKQIGNHEYEWTFDDREWKEIAPEDRE